MKFKRTINIILANNQDVTIPDGEFWKVCSYEAFAYKQDNGGLEKPFIKLGQTNSSYGYPLETGEQLLASGARVKAVSENRYITGLAFTAD